MDEPKKSNSVFISIVVVVIIAVIGYVVYAFSKKDTAVVQTPIETPIQNPVEPVTSTGTTTPPIDVPKSSVYKNGSYSATGNYISPGGSEQIIVDVTLKDDVITDATVVPQATRREAIRFQGMFTSGFKQFVVGRKIDDVQLSKVSGSSLTPGGFNDALAKIKSQAVI